MNMPRNEYPRPQYVRNECLCLNGEWDFEIDYNDGFRESGWPEKAEFKKKILVPFCPESVLSGIEHTDFMDAVWYRREVEIPKEWDGKNVLLHFQAVDYDAIVWVNGKVVGRHRGGFTPFYCDLKDVVSPGETAAVVLRAQDPKDEPKARGKQVQGRYCEGGCYRRTTGIWQTVWMEPVAETWLDRARITPDLEDKVFYVEQPVHGPKHKGMKVKIILSDKEGEIISSEKTINTTFTPILTLTIPENRLKLWDPDNPFLYDLKIELFNSNGKLLDELRSYAGMRGISFDGLKVNINEKPVFQRQVLDQGYYPAGIMTAPSDAALKNDIEISMKMGFNSARLHQKVFEERFLYWADKLGYMVWGEFGDWGTRNADMPISDRTQHEPMVALIHSWTEILRRDYSHPSIVGWCPLNENYGSYKPDEITSLDDFMPIRLAQVGLLLRNFHVFVRVHKNPCKSTNPLGRQSSTHCQNPTLARIAG